ncbi:MAG: hypothetical protein ACRC8P_03080 [Spiroplasma sp.]
MIKKNHQGGESTLVSQTGKTNGQKFKAINLDSKDREIAKLRKQLKEKELENEILKKFDEWMKKNQ